MNKSKGGGSSIALPPNGMKLSPQEKREQLKHHPRFFELMRHELEVEGVEFPKDEIPAELKTWLFASLMDIPFANLGVPMPVYEKMLHKSPEEWSFGVLQKAVDIVYNSKPNAHRYVHSSAEVITKNYASIIKSIIRMRLTFEELLEPIREKVLDKVVLELAPSIAR